MNLDNPKLFSLEGAVARREVLRAAGKRVVLTNGVFDLLHTGHLFYLQQARALGDALFIALNADASVRALKGPSRPVQSEEQRAYALGALACVDAVFIFRTPRLDAEIRALRPDVYTKAGDYTLEKLDAGERIVAIHGIGKRDGWPLAFAAVSISLASASQATTVETPAGVQAPTNQGA